MRITFNGEDQAIGSIEELGLALDRFDRELNFELWIVTKDGPSIAMFRNADRAYLTYLRFEGDSGFVSKGDSAAVGTFRLSNRQTDEHPLSWCIDLERGYKAIAYFFVNGGARYEFVDWQTG